MKLLATTGLGLESVLKNEVTIMGHTPERVSPGRVFFEADFSQMIEANMLLRSADRVYWILGEFRATSFDELYDGVRSLDLDAFAGPTDRVDVLAKTYKSTLYAPRSIQKIAKKAISDALMARYAKTHLPEDGKVFELTIMIEHDLVSVALNTSGEGLHKRGYRISGAGAPIRENVAAALILLARYFGKGPFFDPMCGSGTLVVEAAMIAMNKAPNLKRAFALEKLPEYERAVHEQLRQKLRSQERRPEASLLGMDVDARAVSLSWHHAKRAGVANQVHMKQQDLKDFSTELRGGTLVTNAPYGKRIEAKGIAQIMAKKLLGLETYSLGLLMGDQSLSAYRFRKVKRVRKVYNGNVLAYYYLYDAKKRW